MSSVRLVCRLRGNIHGAHRPNVTYDNPRDICGDRSRSAAISQKTIVRRIWKEELADQHGGKPRERYASQKPAVSREKGSVFRGMTHNTRVCTSAEVEPRPVSSHETANSYPTSLLASNITFTSPSLGK